MIQLAGFTAAKEMARLPYGERSGEHFHYHADPWKRWESARDSRVILDAVGALSLWPGNLGDVRAWLGDLSDEERLFKARYEAIYRQVAVLTTTVPVSLATDVDFYETVLDTRVLRRHMAEPRRVLDVGPGAGRHLANVALRPWGANSAYVGIESIGIPYVLQNLVGATLALEDPSWTFRDQLEHEMGRAPFDLDALLAPRHAAHLPLWRADLLPGGAFDLILCNYVLDELSPPDFDRVVSLLSRCLAPDGVLYCRGAQERSMITNRYVGRYHFGYGAFHQGDITAALRKHGLRAIAGELIASTLTRLFVHAARPATAPPQGLATFDFDAPLIERAQGDYIGATVQAVKDKGQRLLIWADRGLLDASEAHSLLGLLLPHLSRLDVVGVTNEHVFVEGPGPHGFREIPLGAVSGLCPDAVFIVGFRTPLAVRELRDALAPAVLGPVKQFAWPFAHASVEPAA